MISKVASSATTLLLLLTASCATQPVERARSVEVRAGETAKVGQSSQWDAACNRTLIPDVTITERPANGAVEVRQTVSRLETAQTFGNISCVGREVEGMGVFYTPRPGFRGVDRIGYKSTLPGIGATATTVTITVK